MKQTVFIRWSISIVLLIGLFGVAPQRAAYADTPAPETVQVEQVQQLPADVRVLTVEEVEQLPPEMQPDGTCDTYQAVAFTRTLSSPTDCGGVVVAWRKTDVLWTVYSPTITGTVAMTVEAQGSFVITPGLAIDLGSIFIVGTGHQYPKGAAELTEGGKLQELQRAILDLDARSRHSPTSFWPICTYDLGVQLVSVTVVRSSPYCPSVFRWGYEENGTVVEGVWRLHAGESRVLARPMTFTLYTLGLTWTWDERQNVHPTNTYSGAQNNIACNSESCARINNPPPSPATEPTIPAPTPCASQPGLPNSCKKLLIWTTSTQLALNESGLFYATLENLPGSATVQYTVTAVGSTSTMFTQTGMPVGAWALTWTGTNQVGMQSVIVTATSVYSNIAYWATTTLPITMTWYKADDVSALIPEAQTAIRKLMYYNIMPGVATSTFMPYAGMSRATMAESMAESFRYVTGSTVNPDACGLAFSDIGGLTDSVQRWIKQICALNITLGVGTDSNGRPLYAPTNEVPREQMALFISRLYRAVNLGVDAPVVTTPFSDLDGLTQESKNAIARIYGLQITLGTSATTFAPNDIVPRWQMALFINRLLAKFGK